MKTVDAFCKHAGGSAARGGGGSETSEFAAGIAWAEPIEDRRLAGCCRDQADAYGLPSPRTADSPSPDEVVLLAETYCPSVVPRPKRLPGASWREDV